MSREGEGAIARDVLQIIVNKLVSEKLGSLCQDLNGTTKNMTPDKANEARQILLNMIVVAFGEFQTKMRKRIEKGSQSE